MALTIDDVRQVGVVGAGAMGRQIALNTAFHGYPVALWDASGDQMAGAKKWLDEYVAGRVAKGRWTREQADKAVGNMTLAGSMEEAVKDADLVIEVVVEDADVKRKVFAELDRLAPPRAVLATNSSHIVSSRVADATKRPSQIANFHYFNPAMVMELVEVVQGPHTAPETVELLMEFARRTGKTPILLKREIDGFVANRLLNVMFDEALYLVDQGYATTEDVDLAAEKALGYPMGPFRLMDLTGIDVNYLVRLDKYKATGDPADKPSRILEEKYKAGHLGRKTGRGFYEY